MKFSKTLMAVALTGMLTTSTVLSSCQSDKEPEIPQPNPESIARQVKQAINNEIDLMALTDTISFANTSDSLAQNTNERPIVINNLKVLVSTDEYSTALKEYNRRLRDGQRFALKMLFFILPMILLLVLIVGTLWYMVHKTKERNRIIEEAIHNGYNLPDSFYQSNETFSFRKNSIASDSNPNTPPPTNRDQKLFNSGISFTVTGLGLFICMMIWGGLDAAAICLIPIFIGIGKLVTYYR